jgi:hypothetical protein
MKMPRLAVGCGEVGETRQMWVFSGTQQNPPWRGHAGIKRGRCLSDPLAVKLFGYEIQPRHGDTLQLSI